MFTYTITVSTIKTLKFRADKSIKTEETEIRLLHSNQSDHDLHNCHSICAFFYGRTGITGVIYSKTKVGCARCVCGMFFFKLGKQKETLFFTYPKSFRALWVI